MGSQSAGPGQFGEQEHWCRRYPGTRPKRVMRLRHADLA